MGGVQDLLIPAMISLLFKLITFIGTKHSANGGEATALDKTTPWQMI